MKAGEVPGTGGPAVVPLSSALIRVDSSDSCDSWCRSPLLKRAPMDTTQYPRNEALEAAVAAEPEDDAPRLVYADWLDENGDPQRAKYVRACCALDDKPPTDDYVALWEQRREAEAAMERRPPPQLPPPFVLACRSTRQDW